MVTIAQLQAQKRRILDRRDKAAQRQRLAFDKIALQNPTRLY